MPELPEVETIVRHLNKKIRGKRITDVQILGTRVFRYHKKPSVIKRKFVGRAIENIERHGKKIIFKLSGGANFIIHLMMTGRLFLNPAAESPHDRMVINLSGRERLVFNDIRQFGWCRVAGRREVFVAPDALSVDFKVFKSLLAGRKANIKSALLNQKIISGIGNIYADEILWQASIHPLRKTASLQKNEIVSLYRATKNILTLAIKKGGTSSRDYRLPDGSRGGYYAIRRAYQRAGEKCSRDGEIVKRIKIGQRSAYFCPNHQN